jgi:hypothetical protein
MRGVRGRELAGAAVACLVAALVATGSAHSAARAVTKTSITTPGDLAYLIYQYNNPNTFKVAGTATGASGSHVDLVCYYGSTSATIASNVAVNNGKFVVSGASLEAANVYTPCRLRAIPSGTTPGNLTPFAGPRLLVGFNRLYNVTSGANSGKLYEFYSFFQQLGGGFDFESLSGCGVCDGYLTTSNFAPSTVTWWSNAALYSNPAGPVHRSELQIDGANAYLPHSADQINEGAPGMPTLTYSYSQNTKTGDTLITETEPIVKCANATYPPTKASCPTFVSAGVTATVTMTQDHSGLVAWASDVFKSTDGKSHSLDLLWDNTQDFHCGGKCVGDSTKDEYEFPGKKTYSTHVLGDTVSVASGPGTIFVKVKGSPDGDPLTGRGAMVYDRTATQAYFRDVETGHESFTLHQTATVPAGGSTRFRFAYVQGYKSAEVASLAQYATAIFKGCTVPNLVGKSLAAAKKALARAYCAVGKITHVHSAKVPAGRVVSERPKAKTHVDYGTAVNLVISKGN